MTCTQLCFAIFKVAQVTLLVERDVKSDSYESFEEIGDWITFDGVEGYLFDPRRDPSHITSESAGESDGVVRRHPAWRSTINSLYLPSVDENFLTSQLHTVPFCHIDCVNFKYKSYPIRNLREKMNET